MKKHITLGFALALLLGTALSAQPHGGRMFKRIPGGKDPLVDQLKLSESQKAAWQKVRDDVDAKVEPMIEEHRSLHMEIREELESGNPNPTELGQQMIAGHALRKQIRAALKEADGRFVELLDADQRKDFEELRNARRTLRFGPDVPEIEL